jgi:hypothetical protein
MAPTGKEQEVSHAALVVVVDVRGKGSGGLLEGMAAELPLGSGDWRRRRNVGQGLVQGSGPQGCHDAPHSFVTRPQGGQAPGQPKPLLRDFRAARCFVEGLGAAGIDEH